MTRLIGTASVVAVVLGTAIVAVPLPSPALVVPSVVGVLTLAAVVATWPRSKRWLAPATFGVALVSLGGSALWLRSPGLGGGTWTLLLTAVLMVLLALLCRWAPPVWAWAVGVPAVVAEALLILPTTGSPPLRGWEAVGACAFWSLAGLVGAASGTYLRLLDARRGAAVRAARRAQQVRLAADLHDHVAHDVSAMVLQAQAARVLLGDRAGDVAAVLERIEADGARALTSMQQSIRVLREDDPKDRDVADLTALVEQHPTAVLHVDPELAQVPAALYRVVAESLTNVRKHAGPDAGAVVRLERDQDRLVVTVTNPAGTSSQGPGLGFGLSSLDEQVRTLGGTFSAGPVGHHWEVRAVMQR
ncbi:sensor histidine kinase [Cryptosporangium aurantiacum]|uniref:histidine kinase n=1 Tax=Cryptosporangium aurantiacum TaxID=134849 RepID=A0A1M7R821_9ACTN|nr:histidine kinase [Cryptosporangium aurantiacum]SHN42454.1 Histidine kinase [Cryptosporangium aurantiacum]